MITPARLDTFLKVMEQQYPEEWASGKGPLYWYIDYKVSYRRAVELQARLLAKTLTGEIAEYVPLMTR